MPRIHTVPHNTTQPFLPGARHVGDLHLCYDAMTPSSYVGFTCAAACCAQRRSWRGSQKAGRPEFSWSLDLTLGLWQLWVVVSSFPWIIMNPKHQQLTPLRGLSVPGRWSIIKGRTNKLNVRTSSTPFKARKNQTVFLVQFRTWLTLRWRGWCVDNGW